MSKKAVHSGPHKYMLVEWGEKKTPIHKCILPGCAHYVHTIMAENRESLCWKCGDRFILTKDKLERVKPKCDKCIRRKGPAGEEVFKSLDDLIEGLK